MLSHIAEWTVAVLAGGVIAGLVVVAAGAAGGGCCTAGFAADWEGATVMVARYARHNAVGTVAGGRVRLPPRVVHDLRRRINGPPEVW